MTALLRKRIKRIEAEVTAPVAARSKVTILTEPNEDAEPAEAKRHDQELAQAMHEHEKVIVVSARYKERTEAEDGLVYVPTEIQALMEKLSTTPSGERTGNRDYSAWIAGLPCRLIGVNPSAANPRFNPPD